MFDLSSQALDDLQTTLQDEFDDKWKNLYKNFDDLKDLVATANALTNTSSAQINDTLNEILSFYNINKSTGISSIPGYASGTKSAKGGLSWTQEKGLEAIIRPSSGAVLTPVEPGDIIPNAVLSENLFKWGTISPATFLKQNENNVPNVTKVEPNIIVTQNYDSLLRVDGNVDSTVISDLEGFTKNMQKSTYQYTINNIQKDLRKSGWR